MSHRRRSSPRRSRSVVIFVLFVGLLAAGGTVLWAKWRSADSESAMLMVRYRTGAPARAAVARPWLEIINTSRQTITLSDVMLRYYYTADGDAAYGTNCVQAALGCSNVTQKTTPADDPAPGADHYLGIGFTAKAGTSIP